MYPVVWESRQYLVFGVSKALKLCFDTISWDCIPSVLVVNPCPSLYDLSVYGSYLVSICYFLILTLTLTVEVSDWLTADWCRGIAEVSSMLR
jgi:hypothetical protein